MKIFRFFSTALVSFVLIACAAQQASPIEITETAPAAAFLPTTRPTASPPPTIAPTAKIEPTPIPMLEGNCANPIQPLVEGSRSRFRVSNEFGEFFFSIQTTDHQIAKTETMQLRYTDETLNFDQVDKVACDKGAIYNYPSYIINMLFAGHLNKYIDTVHIEGNTYPSYANLANDNWTSEWDLILMTEDGIKLTAPGVPGWFDITPSSNVFESYAIAAVLEPIETPAGKFNAFKVTHLFKFLGTIPPIFTDSQAGTMAFSATEWYAPNIGLVKAELLKVTIESTGQISEIPLSGGLELVELSGIQ